MNDLISPQEREQARPVAFSAGTHRDNRVTFPTTNPDELVFEFGDAGWVEGTSPGGERLRIPLAEVDRFDIETSTREGDDKTHHFYWLLIAAGERKLIYTTREPEYVYNPIPGLTRKDIVELNFQALRYLATQLPMLRSPFGTTEPWKAFREEGETGPPKSPEQRKAEEPTNAQLFGFCAGWVAFMVFCVWLLWKRISRLLG